MRYIKYFILFLILILIQTGLSAKKNRIYDNGFIRIDNDTIPKTKEFYIMSEVDRIPECTNLKEVARTMRYPELAREAGIEGYVKINLLIDENGEVFKIVSYEGNDVFRDVVMNAAVNLFFSPAIKDNKPVKCYGTIPFRFHLIQNKKKN